MKRDRVEEVIRQKINLLEATDDAYSVDADKLWTRLDAKINVKPVKTRRVAFYWAAAAVLLITISIIVLLPRKNDNRVAVSNINKKVLIPKESSARVNSEEQMVEVLMNTEDPHTYGLFAKPVITAACYDVHKNNVLTN